MGFLKRIIYPLVRAVIRLTGKRNDSFLPHTEWGIVINGQGRLVIGGCDSVALTEKYGTPLFVVNNERLVQNYREFASAFASHNIHYELYYSYKTNPVPGIVRVLHEQGAGAEAISPYELWLADQMKVDPGKTIYNGPNKSDDGLAYALERKIKLININSFTEIDKMARIAQHLKVRPQVGIRVTTGGGWGNQFGFSIANGDAFKAVEKLAKLDDCLLTGIHVHLGSGLKTTVIYENAIREIIRLMLCIKQKLGIDIRFLDLGGGFGVATVKSVSGIEARLHHDFYQPYAPPKLSVTPSITRFVDALVFTLKANCASLNLQVPTLLLEPGRALTSNAEFLLTRIGDLKKVTDHYQIALADAGINLAHPLSWEYHEIFVADKMTSSRDRCYGIAGPICSPMDLYIKSKWLPTLEIGSLLCIADAGAYFTSFSTEFSFPRPAIILAHDGNATIIRRRASYQDLTHLDEWGG